MTSHIDVSLKPFWNYMFIMGYSYIQINYLKTHPKNIQTYKINKSVHFRLF